MPDILSTDPNAGELILSDDPNAGEPVVRTREQRFDEAVKTGRLPQLLGQGIKEGVVGIARTPATLARGAKALASPSTVGEWLAGGGPQRVPGQIVQYAGERYGSPKKALVTAATDPVGLLGDLSTALMPARAVGSSVAKADLLGNAVKAGTRGAAGAVERGSHRAATHGMSHAMKPLVSIEQRNPGVLPAEELALKYRTPVSQKGARRAADLKAQTIGERNQKIAAANATPVQPQDIFRSPQVRTAQAEARRSPSPSFEGSFGNTIEHNKDLFSTKQMTPAGVVRVWQPTTLGDIEKLKEKINVLLSKRNQFGQPVTAGENAALDAIRSAEKALIENRVPGVKDLNKTYGELKVLERQLERAARRNENLDIIPLRAWMGGMGAAGATGGGLVPALATAGAIKYGLGPNMISRAAIGVDRAGQLAGTAGRGAAAVSPYAVGPASIWQRMIEQEPR